MKGRGEGAAHPGIYSSSFQPHARPGETSSPECTTLTIVTDATNLHAENLDHRVGREVRALLKRLAVEDNRRQRTASKWRPWIAYAAVAFVCVLVIALALAGLLAWGWSPTAVAGVAAFMMLISGAMKLVAAAEDVSDRVKDRLSLMSQALALFGGSGGLVTLVNVLAQ